MGNKIIFNNGKEFEIGEYPIESEPSVFEKKGRNNGVYREMFRATVSGEYADVSAAFVDGASYFVRQYDVDERGTLLDTYTDFDKSDFSIAGDIVDHRDGRITVYMGKKTEDELEKEQLVAALEAAGVNVYES